MTARNIAVENLYIFFLLLDAAANATLVSLRPCTIPVDCPNTPHLTDFTAFCNTFTTALRLFFEG